MQLNLQIDELKLDSAQPAAPSGKDNDSKQVKQLQAKVAELESELDQKINNTAQMKSMKKILEDKNKLISDLRAQLGQS